MAANITEQQQRSFRRRLRQTQARLRGELRFEDAASAEWEQAVRGEPEFEESGMLAYERDASLAVAAQLQGRLAEIEAALARLDAGTFGVCERCGRRIEARRLEAMPETRYCLRCAQEPAGSGGAVGG